MRWWWLDTRWACGGVATDSRGFITAGAPIFRRLVGKQLAAVVAAGGYKVIEVQ